MATPTLGVTPVEFHLWQERLKMSKQMDGTLVCHVARSRIELLQGSARKVNSQAVLLTARFRRFLLQALASVLGVFCFAVVVGSVTLHCFTGWLEKTQFVSLTCQGIWVWVKIKPPGDRRFWSMFPLTRVPFEVPILDPQPYQGMGSWRRP